MIPPGQFAGTALTPERGRGPCRVAFAGESDRASWDAFVGERPEASHFHQFAWRDVIQGTYGHRSYYLLATRDERSVPAGVLPLFHLKSTIFGSTLVSLPFVDGGGILADDGEVSASLLDAAANLAKQIGAQSIELRSENDCAVYGKRAGMAKRPGKVRMLMVLPGSWSDLCKSFKSKLRSQIGRPLKEGCTARIGGLDLLEDFYSVFVTNMRDLGSPVHSKALMRQVLEAFPGHSRIFAVYHGTRAVAASLVIGFNGVLRNPWASSDRRYAAMSPNMLLYARMLEYACDNGYRTFDFGRSTQGEGTYRFKEQWGARPAPLHWYVLFVDGAAPRSEQSPAARFELAARVWSKLPVAVTRFLGPRIRKHISL
jgi:serine/alanine adding enzyme